MERSMIEEFIEKNKSNYTSKYKFNSFFKKNDYVYKFHYYTRDSQLTEINLFLEIQLYDEVLSFFTEEIHDYEKKSLIVDALTRLLPFIGESKIGNKEIKERLKSHDLEGLSKYDILVIFYYILYHNGINQKGVDHFYSYYIPHYKNLLNEIKYEEALDELGQLFNAFMYEIFWTGSVFDYLDQQYYLHLYYIKLIFEISIKHMSAQVLTYNGAIHRLLKVLFAYPRFTLCLISIIDDIDLSVGLRRILLNSINVNLGETKETSDALPVRYLQAIFYEDQAKIDELVQEIFFALMKDMLRLANHDMQIALGTYFLEKYGYDILIKTFSKSYDVNLLKVFEVESIPSSYYPFIQEELIKALHYYAKLVEKDDTRIRALEQITLINRIILANFKDTMYKG